MSIDDQSLQSVLESLARGSSQHLDAALRMLANAVIILPIRPDPKNVFDLECLSVPDISECERSLIPVFTTEENFKTWASGEEFRCLALPGADVASTVPGDVWLVLNPGTSTEVEFSPEEVARLLLFENELSDIADSEPLIDMSTLGSSSNTSSEMMPSSHDVVAKLEAVLINTGLIREAYYVQIAGSYPTAMLGLLTRKIEAEERFNLMAEIADISKEMFDFAGAIEVYDDLDSPASASWDLFSALTPFMICEDFEQVHPLNSRIEKESFSLESPELIKMAPESYESSIAKINEGGD